MFCFKGMCDVLIIGVCDVLVKRRVKLWLKICGAVFQKRFQNI